MAIVDHNPVPAHNASPSRSAASDTGLARPPALFNDSATGTDCPSCDELARIRAALVEIRRGVVSLERGLAALLAAVESSVDHGRFNP